MGACDRYGSFWTVSKSFGQIPRYHNAHHCVILSVVAQVFSSIHCIFIFAHHFKLFCLHRCTSKLESKCPEHSEHTSSTQSFVNMHVTMCSCMYIHTYTRAQRYAWHVFDGGLWLLAYIATWLCHGIHVSGRPLVIYLCMHLPGKLAEFPQCCVLYMAIWLLPFILCNVSMSALRQRCSKQQTWWSCTGGAAATSRQ